MSNIKHDSSNGSTRRQFLQVAGGAAAGIAVGPVESLFAEKAAYAASPEPSYLRVGGRKADFNSHLTSERRSGKFTLGGVDYKFIDGVPIVSPCNGTIKLSSNTQMDGGTLLIDYGIIQVYLTHLDKLFKGNNELVKRSEGVVAVESDEGKSVTAGYHTHMTVIGNAVLQGILELKQHNYKGNIGNYKTTLYDKWNFVIDPEKLRAGTPGPLFERPWRIDDPDFDKPYLDYVNGQVKDDLLRLVHEIRERHDTQKIARLREDILLDEPLVMVINDLHRITDNIRTETGTLNPEIRQAQDRSDESVIEAGKKIQFTSFYINHTHPETITWVAQQEYGEVQKLILADGNYGQFLPDDFVQNEMPRDLRDIVLTSRNSKPEDTNKKHQPTNPRSTIDDF